MGTLVIAIGLLRRGHMFEPVQRGLSRQRLAPLAPCLQLTRERCHYQIAAQLIVIVQILIPSAMPTMRCITKVCTECSINPASRPS